MTGWWVLIGVTVPALGLALGLWLGAVLVPAAVEAWEDRGADGPRVTEYRYPVVPVSPDVEARPGAEFPQLGGSGQSAPQVFVYVEGRWEPAEHLLMALAVMALGVMALGVTFSFRSSCSSCR